jgi:CPA2 family monovalent cation:H+ antiporter-2
MHQTLPVLRELVIVTGFALAISVLFRRLGAPAIIGFLLTGAVIGPGGLGLIHDLDRVHVLAEIGVVLLMFTVGLELSLADLRTLGGKSLAAGGAQTLLTVALVAPLLLLGRVPPAQAVFAGLLAALSSTAVILKLLADRAEVQSPHGRLSVGILLVQDLAIVPISLAIPVLAQWRRGAAAAAHIDLQQILGFLFTTVATGLVIWAAWRWLPLLLRRLASLSHEAFLAGVMLTVLGSAYLGAMAGLSLAIGAFVAGLIVAGSDVSAQVAADVLPFRDTLSSVFFISIGMLFSPSELAHEPLAIAGATLGLILLKTVATAVAGRLAGYPFAPSLASGFTLAHVGEFAFVLLPLGVGAGLLSDQDASRFVLVGLLSMVISPWLVSVAPAWALALERRFVRVREPALSASDATATPGEAPARVPQVLVAGFGLNGRNVSRVLRAVRIPHIVIDQQPDRIAACAADGSPALLGNAARSEILIHAGIREARALVVALSDPLATRSVVRLARELKPQLFIVVRTRYVAQVDGLYETGANVVIPEEFETSIEIFAAVLEHLHVPGHVIEAQIRLLRRERYSILRGRKLPGSVIEQLETLLAEGTTETALVLKHSPAVNRTLGELEMLGERGSRAIAVVRGGEALTDLAADFRLVLGDTLVLTGSHAAIDAALERLSPPRPSIAETGES